VFLSATWGYLSFRNFKIGYKAESDTVDELLIGNCDIFPVFVYLSRPASKNYLYWNN
jgi:hypothetical protein